MFTTFYGMAPATAGRDEGDTETSKAPQPSATRPRRSQVRRACDWCKLMRIKCDNHRPCSHCRQADRACTVSGDNQFRNMAEAVNEVKRLRAQVRAFEEQTPPPPATASAPGSSSGATQQHPQQPPKEPDKHQQEAPSDLREQPPVEHVHRPDQTVQRREPERRPTAPAVAVSPPADTTEASSCAKNKSVTDRSPPPSGARNGAWVDSIFYGVTSMPFFLSRMDQFLQTGLQRPQLDLDLDVFTYATSTSRDTRSSRAPIQLVNYINPPQDTIKSSADGYLPRAQESLFLDLFWQTHYFGFPILNEAQFRREYKSLWDESPGGGPRKASPLVDIVTALCIQLGGFLVRQRGQAGGFDDRNQPGQKPSPDYKTSSLGGFQYYRRCQDAIDQMTESPSIEHVRCSIFSIVYLYEAGLLNSAHVAAGKAIMMAMILGLPNEPQAGEPEPQREVARRTWWSLYILDAKLSMEVGRPPLIGPSHSTCQLPSDSNDVARWLGPHYSFDDSCPTWLGFQTQTLRLLDAVLSVRSVFLAKYDSIVGSNGYKDFVSDAVAREECACLLTERMKDINEWARQVPGGYLVARRHGQPLSTDRTPLMFEANMIIHCQRQRLLLELQYHEYCMSLYQPFICFASSADELTPVSDAKATAALAHAMTLTSMIHQTLTNTEALSGIYHVYRFQKNALFTMLGFAYTFPINGSAAATRKSIEMAIAVIEMYRDILPEAGPVAAVGRVLAEDASSVLGNIGTGNSWSSSLPSTSSVPTPVLPLCPTPGGRAAGSDAPQTTASKLLVPAVDPDLVQQDWNMMVIPSTDKVISQEPLHQLGEEGADMQSMDMLWASLDPGDVPNIDRWMAMGGSIV
ncbi:hypothetical protein F4803DRAFT_555673 [Xylaria telfairii]|nr:hypothetical protein F4803DRAFT_555673 [Xylaria telfairii]